MPRRLLLLILVLPCLALGQVRKCGDEFSTIHATPDRTCDVQNHAIDVTRGYPQKDVAGTVTTTLKPLKDGLSRIALAIAAIRNVLNSDTSYAAQASAATALKNAKAQNAPEVLTNALTMESHNDVVRRSVRRALADMNMPDQARPLILEWTKYGKLNGTRTTTLSLLPRVARGAEPGVIAQLISLLEDPWMFSRESAIEALGEMRAAEAIDALEIRAEVEFDASLRKASRESIARSREK